MTDKLLIDDEYWPHPLRHIPNENPIATKHVVVAEISQPWGVESYRHIYTALAPPERVQELLNHPGGIGHNVTPTGPHPSPFRGTFHYEPGFSIWAGEVVPEGLEPLVIAWEAGGRTILVPDQGFLMTYGLVPRSVQSATGDLIHWDDVTRPQHDVVIAKMVSEYFFELKSEARVSIDLDYLRDYATVRNRSLIHVFYASNVGPARAEDRYILAGNVSQEFKLKGRLVDLRIAPQSKSQVLGQVWGVRRLLDPLYSPVTEGRWDYGRLVWPGIKGEVTLEGAQRLGLKYVYVKDEVLKYYEDYPEKYSISPESGSVSYGGQWSVSYCRRVMRDLIQLEIKKLYEGCPPDVVKHWHGYAVEPPTIHPVELGKLPNVAIRSKNIVYALVVLGEILSNIANTITGKNLTSIDFVKLSRDKLDYYGWQNEPSIATITCHIPLTIGKNTFLERCKDLNSLVIEGLDERNLRKLLLGVSVNSKHIKDFRGLKLLDVLIQYAITSRQTGLNFVSDSDEIERRWVDKYGTLKKGQHLETPIDILFILYDLRVSASHREKNIDELLVRLGIDHNSVVAGWGSALDRLYDTIRMALEKTSEVLRDIV